MKACSIEKIRNFAITGHAGSGKTSLAELMLFKSGAIARLGSVADGTTVSDYRKDEQDRRASIASSVLNCTYRDHEFFFTDNPGYADFCGETYSSIRASNMALIVVDAVAGIGPGALRASRVASEYDVPRAFFINGLDKDSAHYSDILEELKESFGRMKVIPMVIPLGENASFKGVVHSLRTPKDQIPAEFQDQADKDRQLLIDAIAETDDALMEKVLADEKLTDDEIANGLHKAVALRKIIPVFCGSVAKDLGVTELMNGVINLFPSAKDAMPYKLDDENEIKRDPADPEGIAWVFKSVNDPHMGQITYLRIISGTWKPNETVYNVNRSSQERLGGLSAARGKTMEELDYALPGMFVAITKLKNTQSGDTLCLKSGSQRIVAPVKYPAANMIYAVKAVNKGEEDKIAIAIGKLCAEDPTLSFSRHPETGEELFYGMGDQHLNIAKQRLKNEFKIDINFEQPKVPYRETISGTGDHRHRHKKQSGGHGQFAEVHLRVDPCADGYEFCNAVVGGVIPKNYIPAVEKGVVEAMDKGPLAHCRVINIKVTVDDGKDHPVDSSEMAFKIASRIAFRESMKKAKPILLEPIRLLKIYIPDQYMGDVSGDLNTRRARILGMGAEDGLQVITAEMPLAESFNYSTQLRSITQGKGFYDIEPLRYDVVPANIAQKIQAEAAKLEEEEED